MCFAALLSITTSSPAKAFFDQDDQAHRWGNKNGSYEKRGEATQGENKRSVPVLSRAAAPLLASIRVGPTLRCANPPCRPRPNNNNNTAPRSPREWSRFDESRRDKRGVGALQLCDLEATTIHPSLPR